MCKKYKREELVQYIYTKKATYQAKISLLHRGVTEFCMNLQEFDDDAYMEYFKENKYLDTLILQADSINSCKNCFTCKKIIDEEIYLVKI